MIFTTIVKSVWLVLRCPHVLHQKAHGFSGKSNCLARSRGKLDLSSDFVLLYQDLVWVTQDSQPQSYQKNAPLTPPMKNYQRILLPNTFGTDFLDQSPNLRHHALRQQKCCTAGRRAISQRFLPHHRKPQTSSTLKPVTGGARPVRTERPETNTRRDREHLRILVGTSDTKI